MADDPTHVGGQASGWGDTLTELDAVLLSQPCPDEVCDPHVTGPHRHPKRAWVITEAYWQGARMAAQALGYTPAAASDGGGPKDA